MTRTQQHLSDELIADNESQIPPATFSEMESAIETLIKHIDGTYKTAEKIPGSSVKRKIMEYYITLYLLWEKDKPTEKKIFRYEAIGHRQTLLYRVCTTICIGFLIMVIYGIAQFIGIQMPLRF